MKPLAVAKLGLAAVGILLWGYGARAELAVPQWTGVALVFAAFLLRFLTRAEGRSGRSEDSSSGDA